MASVSVISVVKNHAIGLKATYKSLLQQSYFDWEMVIVVGTSHDDTLTVAKELQRVDSRILVLEQSGSGIYEAMNEGLTSVSGEFTWFMNAGDRFASVTTLAHAVSQINLDKAGAVFGGYQIEESGETKTFIYSTTNITPLSFAFNRRGGCHQAIIFRTNILKILGGFNTIYKLAADFDLIIRIIREFKTIRVPEIYASIEPGGRADQGIFLVHSEKHIIRKNLLGNPILILVSIIWTLLARTKIFIRQILRIINT